MKWFLGSLVLLLAALVLRTGLLAYAMYVLLGLLLVSRFLARNWVGGLTAERFCRKPTAEVGESTPVKLTIRNGGWLPVPWVLLEDLLPGGAVGGPSPALKVRGRRVQLRMLRPRGEGTLAYHIEFLRRGYHQVGPLVLEGGDLFGLHRRYRVAAEPAYVLVYPKTVPLEGYDLASRRPVGEVRLTHRLYEDPTRIAGVRGYQAGDPLSRVHWKATARTGQLHCKLYEPSTLAGATLLLDFHRDGYPATREPDRSELAVTAAASLANAVYEMGQQVGLVTNGRDAADRVRLEGWKGDYRTRRVARRTAGMQEESDRLRPQVVPTRRGVEQFQRIREALARVELTDGLTFSQLVAETTHRLPRDATVVAVLPSVTEEAALALGGLHRLGYAVTAILVAPGEDGLATAQGRLMAQGVLDVRHLGSEAALPGLCRQQVRGGASYALQGE